MTKLEAILKDAEELPSEELQRLVSLLLARVRDRNEDESGYRPFGGFFNKTLTKRRLIVTTLQTNQWIHFRRVEF